MNHPLPHPDPGGPVAARYAALVRRKAIERDPAQWELIEKLDTLAAELVQAKAAKKKPSALDWLFGGRERPAMPKGLYIWGGVGRGKTMLMDLFYESLGSVRRKRRTHFHAYMADVHARIHDWRARLKRGEVEGDDPIRPVATALAAEASVLCFDEFAVTDITDAMILGRLFTALFEQGVTVVATSNVPPQELYKGGLNRALFLPFIALLNERMETFELSARTDFRLEKLGESPVYFVPADEAARRRLDQIFARLTGHTRPKPARLSVQGRLVEVPAQAMGVARFPYEALCRQPLGTSDYITIARAYHTVLVDGIPVIEPARRDEAKRLINLVDILYERRVKLIASAEAEPAGLYHAESGHEAFEFARTVSRLAEMRSRDYLSLPRADEVSGNTTGLVET